MLDLAAASHFEKPLLDIACKQTFRLVYSLLHIMVLSYALWIMFVLFIRTVVSTP